VDDAVKLKQKPLWRVPLPWKESESEAAVNLSFSIRRLVP